MADEWRIEPTEITEKPRVWEGTFTPEDLPRLDEVVAEDEGELRYRVSAALDPQRRKVVSCIIEGFVFLECQSSLESFRYGVSIADKLVLVDDETQLPPFEEETEDEDFVVAEGPMDVRDLVEDAVILALPMIPRKPGLEAEPVKPTGGAAGPKESPFAALKDLKRPK